MEQLERNPTKMNKIKLAMPRGRIVGEFVLIVLGVLSALMVDTWIEARNDDKLRQEYLTRLIDDLETDGRNLDYRVSFFSDVRSFGLNTLDRIQSDEPVEQEDVLAAYYAAEIYAFASFDSTYVDLHSTGNIRLLRDIDLRLALATYNHRTVLVKRLRSEEYREIVRGIIPWHIQQAIREHCPTTVSNDAVPTGFPPCTIPSFSTADANRIFDKLREHPRIEEILRYRVSEVDVQVFLYGSHKDNSQAVLELLNLNQEETQ